jgi:hypothetical protein
MITGWLSGEDCPDCGYRITWHATDPGDSTDPGEPADPGETETA